MAEKGIFFRLARKDDYYEEITKFVATLRKEGRLAKVLKNGLTLMWDLMNDRTDVLFSLFPNIKAVICENKNGNDNIISLRHEIEALRRELREQQRQIQQGYIEPPPANYPQSKPAGYVPNITAPVAVAVAAAPMSASEIADNFLTQIMQ